MKITVESTNSVGYAGSCTRHDDAPKVKDVVRQVGLALAAYGCGTEVDNFFNDLWFECEALQKKWDELRKQAR